AGAGAQVGHGLDACGQSLPDFFAQNSFTKAPYSSKMASWIASLTGSSPPWRRSTDRSPSHSRSFCTCRRSSFLACEAASSGSSGAPSHSSSSSSLFQAMLPPVVLERHRRRLPLAGLFDGLWSTLCIDKPASAQVVFELQLGRVAQFLEPRLLVVDDRFR